VVGGKGKEATDNHSGKREETRKAQQRQLQQKEKKEPSNLARDAVSKPGSDLDSKDTQNIHIASSDSVAAVKAKIASLRSEYEKLELQNAILLELLESKQAAEEAVGLDIITKQRQVNMLGRELGVDDGSALMREEEAGRREELSPAKVIRNIVLSTHPLLCRREISLLYSGERARRLKRRYTRTCATWAPPVRLYEGY
jgi:hypothetical protein